MSLGGRYTEPGPYSAVSPKIQHEFALLCCGGYACVVLPVVDIRGPRRLRNTQLRLKVLINSDPLPLVRSSKSNYAKAEISKEPSWLSGPRNDVWYHYSTSLTSKPDLDGEPHMAGTVMTAPLSA